MPHTKKNYTINTSHQKNEEGTKKHDELDIKRKMIREKMRTKRVNYVVKDLPIY